MATSNINKMTTLNKKTKHVITTAFKKTCLIEQCYRAIFLEKVNFILSVSCNNENKLKMTLKFTLAKFIFNYNQL